MRRSRRRFAVMPSLFPIEAAVDVLAGGDDGSPEGHDALAAVSRLVDKSLLVRAESAAVTETFTRRQEFHDKFACVYALVPLAATAALKRDHEAVARIIGMRDAVTESTGAMVVDPSTRDLQEQAEREARARLGQERWAAAYAAGRRSSIDALLQDIRGLRPTRGRPRYRRLTS